MQRKEDDPLKQVVERAAREILEDDQAVFSVDLFGQQIANFTQSIVNAPFLGEGIDEKQVEEKIRKEVRSQLISRLDDRMTGEAARFQKELLEYYNAMLLLQLFDGPFAVFVDEVTSIEKEG